MGTDVALSQSFGLLILALASLFETVSLLSQPLGGLHLCFAVRRNQCSSVVFLTSQTNKISEAL